MKFPFWGRHLSPLLAFLVFSAVWACHKTKNRMLGKMSLILLGVLWIGSAAGIRFDSSFQRDDYRSAAAIARQSISERKSTWWAADVRSANFYGVFPTATQPAPTLSHSLSDDEGLCHSIINATKRDLDALPSPDTVVLSKPDIYDNSGDITRFLNANGYRLKSSFTAFQIWGR